MTLPAQRIPLVEGKLITREWLIALRGLDPVSQSESIAALQESIASLQAALNALAAEVSADVAAVDDFSEEFDRIHLRRNPSLPEAEFNPVHIQSASPRQGAQPSDTQALFAARIFGA